MGFSLVLRLSLRLSWAIYWRTVIYGAICLAPFAILVDISGDYRSYALAAFAVAGLLLLWFVLRQTLRKQIVRKQPIFWQIYPSMILGYRPDRWKIHRHASALARPLFILRIAAACLALLLMKITGSGHVLVLSLFVFETLFIFARFMWVSSNSAEHICTEAEAEKAIDQSSLNVKEVFKDAVVAPLAAMAAVWIVLPVGVAAISMPMDEDAAKFHAKTNEYKEIQNGFYAFLGILAGAEMEDAYETGEAMAARLRDGRETDPIRNPPQNALRGVYDICRKYSASGEPPCRTIAEWRPIIQANEDLLNRYDRMLNYAQFAWTTGDFSAEWRALTTLKAIRNVATAYESDPEKAMILWLRDMRFRNHLLQTSVGLRGFERHLEAYAAGLQMLPMILEARADLAARYQAQLSNILSFEDLRDVDVVRLLEQDTLNAFRYAEQDYYDGGYYNGPTDLSKMRLYEQLRINPKGNVAKEKLYRLHKDIKDVLRNNPPGRWPAGLRPLAAKYDVEIKAGEERLFIDDHEFASPLVQVNANRLRSYQLRNWMTLVPKLLDQYNLSRMTRLYLNFKMAGGHSNAMPGYLLVSAQSDPLARDVSTDQPFVWNPARQAICTHAARPVCLRLSPAR